MKRAVVAGAIVVIAIIFLIGRRGCGSDKQTTSTHTGSASIGKITSGGGIPASKRTVEVPSWLSQLNVKPRKIAGRVVFDGKPVDGAVVRLALDAGNGVYQPVAQATSAADGSFDFGLQPGARFSVTAEAAQRTPAKVSIEVADPKAKPDQLLLVLGACSSRLYGSVLDASGGAIANAHIRTAGLAGTESDANGGYSACVSQSNVEIRVEADGYGTIVVTVQLIGELRYDFVLVPEAVLVGQVITEDKRPVANAGVIALPDPSEGPHHIASGWAMTDDDGRFRIPGLSPGHYRLVAAAEGLASNAPVDAMAKAGTAAADTIIVVNARARVSGHVVMADQPVAGARVAAIVGAGPNPFAGASDTGFSQADGSFVLQSVPLGRVSFTAFPHDVTAPKQIEIKSAKVDGVTIEVARLASIHGVITRKGQPVSDAEVQTPQTLVYADASGAYRVDGLQPGNFRFFASSNDHKAFADKRVKLAPGEDKLVDVELDFAGRVTGVVVDESGKPVPSVYVRLLNDEGDVGQSMTDARGQFDAGTMSGGDYLPSVYPSPMAGQPFAPATGDQLDRIKVPSDGVASGIKLAIKYERLAIRGTVVDDTGAPVSDVHIEAIGRGKPGIDLPSIMSAADGTFAIQNLAPGSYNLHAHASDGGEGDLLHVVAGTDNAAIKLIRPGAVEGTLVGFSTTPQVGMLTLTADLFIGGNPIVEGTRFWQTGVRPGKYTIEAKAGAEVAGETVEIRSGETTKVTLKSRGSGKVEGNLFEYGTKTPVAGYRCDANLSMGGQMGGGPPPDSSWSSFPDAKGHFEMAAPIGMVRVFCFPAQGNPSFTVAGIDVEVGSGVTPSVEVYAVRRKTQSGANAGFRIRPLVLPLVVNAVEPKSAAETQGMKVGDRIVAIDGASVQGLLPAGASTLVGNHKPGSIVIVGVDRGGTPLTFKLPVTAAAD